MIWLILSHPGPSTPDFFLSFLFVGSSCVFYYRLCYLEVCTSTMSTNGTDWASVELKLMKKWIWRNQWFEGKWKLKTVAEMEREWWKGKMPLNVACFLCWFEIRWMPHSYLSLTPTKRSDKTQWKIEFLSLSHPFIAFYSLGRNGAWCAINACIDSSSLLLLFTWASEGSNSLRRHINWPLSASELPSKKGTIFIFSHFHLFFASHFLSFFFFCIISTIECVWSTYVCYVVYAIRCQYHCCCSCCGT